MIDSETPIHIERKIDCFVCCDRPGNFHIVRGIFYRTTLPKVSHAYTNKI